MARLVVVCGPPGSGKTTVAGMVADRLDARRLRTDVVRKELVADPTYDDAETERTYAAVVDRARDALPSGEDVVLDGTFRERRFRRAAREAAASVGADWTLVRVTCDEEVARRRIAAREDDASDADVAVRELLRESFEPVEGDHVTVDNSGSLERTREQVASQFGE